MSVRVQCPSCQAIHGVNERLLGRTIPCPACSASMQLPDRADWDRAQERRRIRLQAAAEPVVITEVEPEASPSPAIGAPAPVRPDLPPREEDEDSVGKQTTNRDYTEMDMTPMIDVTFLLLIFFVVTASFQIQKAMEVPKSKSEGQSTRQVDPSEEIAEVTVHVDEMNTFMVLTPDSEQEVAGSQNLFAALREARAAEDPDTPMRLIIKAHVDSKHRAVVAALDAGAELRFAELQLVEVEEFD